MIESIKNEKIKRFIKLSDSKKARKIQNSFVLEGMRLICDSLMFHVKLNSLFLTEVAIKKFKSTHKKLLDSTDYFIISNEVARKISTVEQSQGCFAIAEKPESLSLDHIFKNDRVLMLVGVNNPGNVGTLFRSASAFNFNKVILINCCDAYNPKTVRSSMSAIFNLQLCECSVDRAKLWLKSTNICSLAATTSAKALSISENTFDLSNFGCVLLIGSEAFGLPPDIVDLCDFELKIDMYNGVESLNAGVAGSVLMFKLTSDIDEN